ncbi:MAG: hypothetical protein LBV04_00290 [Deferribacteraceae bacterium]|jgi:hypothetical protein|nr:hypothetical protein [Deferribacteraceae bacterium]
MLTRNTLLTLAVKNFDKMGLDVFLPGTDYRGMKPDILVVHKAKQLYYLVEVLSNSCIMSGARLTAKRADQRIRRMCANLFHGDHCLSALSATLYCDLGLGLDLFRYSEIKGHWLSRMQRYAAVVYPSDMVVVTERAFQTIGIQYKSLEIQGKYYFTLFSEADTKWLAEARKFMQYMLINQG